MYSRERPAARLKRQNKQIQIAEHVNKLNSFVLEPVAGQRCIDFFTLLVELGYLYRNARRKTTQMLLQKLINDTLDVSTFCLRILTVLDLNKRPQLNDFITATIHDARMEFYSQRVILRGIHRPPDRAIGLLREPRQETFPLPIAEDYRGYYRPGFDYMHLNYLPRDCGESPIVIDDEVEGVRPSAKPKAALPVKITITSIGVVLPKPRQQMKTARKLNGVGTVENAKILCET